MARSRPLLLIVLLLSGLALPSAAEEESAASEEAAGNGAPTWYAQALARGAAGLNVTHFWSKGPMLRAETVIAGHKVVTIVKGEWYYAYDGLTGRGLAIHRDPEAVQEDATRGRPFGHEYRSLVRQGAELVREEEMLGRKTGVFRVTDRMGRRELWVTLDEQRLPLRIEIYDRRTTQRRYTDYLNWQSALPIPDAFFAPDAIADLQRIEFSEYLERTAKEGPVGPVPVLYADLLHVPDEE